MDWQEISYKGQSIEVGRHRGLFVSHINKDLFKLTYAESKKESVKMAKRIIDGKEVKAY